MKRSGILLKDTCYGNISIAGVFLKAAGTVPFAFLGY